MPSPRTARRRAGASPELVTTLVLVAPLFLVYEIGVLFTPLANGADLLTRPLLAAAHYNRSLYVTLVIGLTAALAVTVMLLRRKQRLQPARFLPVLLESALYALSLGSAVLFVMTRVLHISPHLAAALGGVRMGPMTELVMAAGAGLNEELVFRAILFGGLLLLLAEGARWRPWVAGLVAAVVSSLLFSAVHHLGPYGEPFTLAAFTFRFLCGLAFVAIYRWRGFAVAAWTHALYDAYVFLLH